MFVCCIHVQNLLIVDIIHCLCSLAHKHVIDMQKLLSTSGQPEEFVSAETPIRAGPSDVVILISE